MLLPPKKASAYSEFSVGRTDCCLYARGSKARNCAAPADTNAPESHSHGQRGRVRTVRERKEKHSWFPQGRPVRQSYVRSARRGCQGNSVLIAGTALPRSRCSVSSTERLEW